MYLTTRPKPPARKKCRRCYFAALDKSSSPFALLPTIHASSRTEVLHTIDKELEKNTVLLLACMEPISMAGTEAPSETGLITLVLPHRHRDFVQAMRTMVTSSRSRTTMRQPGPCLEVY